MGWISNHHWTLESLVCEIIDTYRTSPNFSVLAKGQTHYGRRLWLTIQPKEGEAGVVLFLLKSHEGTWGYKAIDESMGPVYWDCPKAVIEAAGKPINHYSRQWRQEVADRRN